ncbi:unnamed protein product [Echinostoma caproni]|uniref:Retrotransposon protein, putative, Ty3-gypsy subclass n=1 Tax=Echinostoma caproni TaxID=27848 RepID=A0A183B290_9TREM|nr:unnamed protein product [Echinostoma caproni]
MARMTSYVQTGAVVSDTLEYIMEDLRGSSTHCSSRNNYKDHLTREISGRPGREDSEDEAQDPANNEAVDKGEQNTARDRVTIKLVVHRVAGPDAEDEAETASARSNSQLAQRGARKEAEEDEDREARANRNEPDRDARRETRRQQRARLDRNRDDVRRRPRYGQCIIWRIQLANK